MKHTVQNYDGKYLDSFFLKLSVIIINYDFTPVVALLGQPVWTWGEPTSSKTSSKNCLDAGLWENLICLSLVLTFKSDLNTFGVTVYPPTVCNSTWCV